MAPQLLPITTEARFLDFHGRRLFAVLIAPAAGAVRSLLYLPPYAEEMNRCRSHVAAQARSLAAGGWRCLLLDPYGTGESEGDSVASDWDEWLQDGTSVARWLHEDAGQPIALWGMRTGALLAAELAGSGDVPVDRLLLWQPVVDGKQFLTQYLRLRIASQVVHGGQKETTAGLMAQLAEGQTLEVAGYPLAGRLAQGLARRRLIDCQGLAGKYVDWIEMSGRPDAQQPLAAASQRVAETWAGRGVALHAHAVVAPTFWQLAGTHETPELQQLTTQIMESGR